MKRGVLVVEDDPVSGLFFEGVLARAGLAVTLATCGAEAAAHAAHAPHVAWLVDAHLPDGAAADWLPRLRDAAAAQPPAHAVAHTASRSPGLHARLRAAGFHTVLVKPCTGAALLACIADVPPTRVREARMAWDDRAARQALGGARGVEAVRARFLAELPADVGAVRDAAAAGDADRLRATLHRMVAACAFAGAPVLGAAARRLRQVPHDAAALQAFLAAAHALR